MDSETWNSLGDYGKKKLDSFESYLIGKDKYDLEDIAIKYYKKLVYTDYCYGQLKGELKKVEGTLNKVEDTVVAFVVIFWLISYPIVWNLFPYEPADPFDLYNPPFYYKAIWVVLPKIFPIIYAIFIHNKLFNKEKTTHIVANM